MSMRQVLIGFVVTAAIIAEGAVSVTNVVCRQHYPWNGLVDIDYEITSDQPDAKYWVYPKGTDNRLGKRVIMNTLSGDGATNFVGIGKHRMVWDAKADMPRFHTSDLTVTIQAISDGAKYLVIDISGGTNAVTYPVTYSSTPPDVTTDTCRTEELWLRLVLPGTFMMGSPEGERDRGDNEQQHPVRLTKPFYIGVFELTQRQWLLINGNTNAIFYAGDCRPIDGVSYNMIRGSNLGAQWPKSVAVDDDSFMGIMRRKTSLNFDLPTEAQWEYACRAGTTNSWNSGVEGTRYTGGYSYVIGNSELDMLGRYSYNKGDGRESYGEHTNVGMYQPNTWGLYDMHGNVLEWCLDGYKKVMADYEEINPRGSDTTGQRICRGGSWSDYANNCRSAVRHYKTPETTRLYFDYSNHGGLGFRLVCLPVE